MSDTASTETEQVTDEPYQVQGEVNLQTFSEQRRAGEQAIAAAAGRPGATIDFDFGGVQAANSLSVALMTAWFRFAQTQGCEMRILPLPQGLQLIVEFSGLSSVLPLDS
ncbi:MAG: STAS domain-containing protein [Pseudomonadales bacterium]